ncbi:chemotaxis protein CheW [Romboutsia sp.]|uniref:chemotaxis protein CheW n=1 Tax=Romboutsia sp. TaxID=1965302 RepID=UPI003F40EB99
MGGIDSLSEFYVQENMQLLEQLEEILLTDQLGNGKLEKGAVEEIFRVMHTIKGSSSMMGYDSLTKLAHSIEDVFDGIRNGRELSYEKWESVIDVVLVSIDFLKEEISKVQEGLLPDSSIDELHERVVALLIDDNQQSGVESNKEDEVTEMKLESNLESKDNIQVEGEQFFHIKVFFENGCGMEGIRALGVATVVEGLCSTIKTIPEDLTLDCDDVIVKDGFIMYIKTTEEKNVIEKCIEETMFLKNMELREITDTTEIENIFGITINIESEESIIIEEEPKQVIEEHKEIVDYEIETINKALNTENIEKTDNNEKEVKKDQNTQGHIPNKNNYLTVNINKVDMLMNLVGEIVTTESMVEKQSQLENFDRDNFEKQARRLHQLTNELQDVVMSIRMVPISSTFTKMQRVVRDMSKKTGKLVDLILIGEETEVDKNILENISDPLMHMIRNSMDHGIETPEERKQTSKSEKASIILEAKNTGGDVVIIIKDDGRGLNKESIVKKAIEKGITTKSVEEISDKEAYNFILAPGFSTTEAVTEYSGRGVGMDVVYTNIRKLRGVVNIDSEKGKGTMIVLRIPLTLAIIDGMKVKIDEHIYIIPSLNIKEVFSYGNYEIVKNPNGEEQSIIRGNCYKIRRLSKILGIDTEKSEEEIMILVESEMGNVCIIVDSIIGQQQVVIKPIPTLLSKFEKVQSYLSGCSILEDGSISLIFDVNAIINV